MLSVLLEYLIMKLLTIFSIPVPLLPQPIMHKHTCAHIHYTHTHKHVHTYTHRVIYPIAKENAMSTITCEVIMWSLVKDKSEQYIVYDLYFTY